MRVLVGLLAIAACLGCSVENEPNRADPVESSSTTVASTTTAAPSTTVPLSAGLIRVGPAAYDLDFTCVAPGAGDVLAVGLGTDINGLPVEAWVQAYLGEPYVGLRVGADEEEVLFQPRLDATLDFTFESDVVRFDEIDFVTDLDLDTGEFTPAGLGSVVVECRSYEEDLPATTFG